MSRDRSWRHFARIAVGVLGLPLAAGWASRASADELVPLPPQPAGVAWPTSAWPSGPLPEGADPEAIEATLAAGFDGSEALIGETRAVVIIAGGRLVAERYGPGFGAEMPLVSWSMAKSITHAFIGVAVGEGRFDIDQPMGNPRWPEADPRNAITWRQWLNMVDGQSYRELNAPSIVENGAARMLFGPGRLDAAAYAAELPLTAAAGTHWNYNSAGEILLCDALTRAIAGITRSPDERRSSMLAWMRQGLFDPIGMTTAQPEFDATGLYLGSSFVYATARDFAKLGLLYLRDGMWDDHRILPQGWVDFARSPGPAADADIYGAGWWITPPAGYGRPINTYIDTGPARDAFRAEGHGGQIIMVVPSKDLVIVRLGRFDDAKAGWPALYNWIGRLARAFPTVQSPER